MKTPAVGKLLGGGRGKDKWPVKTIISGYNCPVHATLSTPVFIPDMLSDS